MNSLVLKPWREFTGFLFWAATAVAVAACRAAAAFSAMAFGVTAGAGAGTGAVSFWPDDFASAAATRAGEATLMGRSVSGGTGADLATTGAAVFGAAAATGFRAGFFAAEATVAGFFISCPFEGDLVTVFLATAAGFLVACVLALADLVAGFETVLTPEAARFAVKAFACTFFF